jgi:hypothetical protein
MTDDDGSLQRGEVIALKPGEDPPISTLVRAFQEQGVNAATDAIVLRGYLGRSDIIRRTLDYLEHAQGLGENLVLGAVENLAATVDQPPKEGDPNLGMNARLDALQARLVKDKGAATTAIKSFIESIRAFAAAAPDEIPWRLYLTPRLDSYVDFHRRSLLAYRREAKAERYDACTVWLRIFEEGGSVPIPYRVVQETMLGPSFALWLDGAVVDDYVEQGGSGSAWGDQSAVFGGGRYPTGKKCGVLGGGRYPTGARCGE